MKTIWTGRVLSTLAILFLTLDSIGKLLEVPPVVSGTIQLGYPVSIVFTLGVIEFLCVALYVIPRTSPLGAVLLTGYLGGAVATHVRIENPLFSHILFPIYVASFVWAGLALRDDRLLAFLPWRAADGEGDRVQEGGDAMNRVISKDGTAIAFERIGRGPALILVDGALCSRAFGPMPKLAPFFAPHFSVYTYDRRGRGQSGDTRPYSVAREVEDIAALIQDAGEPACLLGLSSGGALALEAAASGLDIRRVAAYEPPYVHDGQPHGADHEAELETRLKAGDRGGAVTYFMRDMVGAPGFVVIMMRLMPWIWRKLKAVAATLPYDAAVMTRFTVPRARLASVTVPTQVMHGSKTDARLEHAARAVAAAVPGATHVTLPGQTHNVKPGALAAAVVPFFTA